jgi:ubiquinone/menaquinone biosynthesis C-methylase UbiE
MPMSAHTTKDEILDQYYRNFYHSTLYENTCQSIGTRYFDARLENSWMNKDEAPKKLLEIGFASGEHISKVHSFPTEEYVGLDLKTPATQKYIDALPFEQRAILNIIQSNAAEMPFADNKFDRVVSTCLLHHVEEPLKVLQEVRRVTQDKGEIAIGIPADPGLLNRFVKHLITYPGMRKIGVENPKLIYALEHPNQVGGLIELAKHVFQSDSLDISYSPFRIRSWNFNLMIVIHVQIHKQLPEKKIK